MTNSEIIPEKREAPCLNNNGRNAGAWTGIFLLVIGGLALAKSFLVPMPGWLFNWQVLLIAIGIFIGIAGNFKGAVWLVMILTGGAFLLNDYYFDGDLREQVWPLVIISSGAILILRPRNVNRRHKHILKTQTGDDIRFLQRDENFADIIILFGSARKNMVTQHFAGGDLTSIFAAAELDLTSAGIQGKAVLDITAIFGGTELIIPSDWTIKSDIVSVFGSVKDKRIQSPALTEDPRKMLILDGTAIFGGIEIRSFKK
ncbi:MAG: hypothetical protein JWM28_1241 [Chitinophagaceae bacterium]|nr:hypothetical protein [Chitinophagaceae bacterium]